MKFKTSLLLSSALLLGIVSFSFTNGTFDGAFAQTNVGVGVETETEIKVGEKSDDEESKVSVEAKSETSAEVKSQTSSEEKSKQESSEQTSETSAKTQSNIQLSLKTSYPKVKASSDNSFVIQSKQKLYQPNDKVRVEGNVFSSLLTQIGGTNMVNVQIFDSKGMLVKENTVQMKNDGSFGSEVQLPPNSANGEYTVKSKIIADSSILGTLNSETRANLESATKVIVSTPSIVKISVEGHNDFEVKVASNSQVRDVKFKESEKKVSFLVEGETGTSGVTQVSIPKTLLSGQMTVMIDGKVMATDDIIVTADTETTTTLELNYSHSVHTIEIVGTNAVPEFGTIAMMILAVAIVSVIAISARSRLSIAMPKY